MIDGTVDDYVDGEEPFLAYYMTVSGHMGYSWGGNAMARKNRDLVKDLDVSEEAKAYVATQIELDRALEHLIAKLEEKGKLDKTVIVLLADHYPYGLSQGAINELSDHERDLNVGACENALILWNNKINDKHIIKPCMSCDVLPTVYNLFGVDYDSRLYCGRDILSSSEGLVIFNNRSWITDKGSYNSQTGKFTPTENVDENYSSRINSIVNNRLNMSKYIIETDYYNYLFH
jgi:phosphoglycerol transferase MdoB-like AlkP superfamily enzyme